MKQMIKNTTRIITTVLVGTLILFAAFVAVNINKSYGQSEEVKKVIEGLKNCIADDYLINQTNIKIIDMLLIDTINKVCVDDVNELLEKDYTIKGTLQDKYIILEKIK